MDSCPSDHHPCPLPSHVSHLDRDSFWIAFAEAASHRSALALPFSGLTLLELRPSAQLHVLKLPASLSEIHNCMSSMGMYQFLYYSSSSSLSPGFSRPAIARPRWSTRRQRKAHLVRAGLIGIPSASRISSLPR